MAFRAAWPGRCGACDGAFLTGDLIAYSDEGSLAHEACLDVTSPAGKPETICPRCFLTACDCGKDT